MSDEYGPPEDIHGTVDSDSEHKLADAAEAAIELMERRCEEEGIGKPVDVVICIRVQEDENTMRGALAHIPKDQPNRTLAYLLENVDVMARSMGGGIQVLEGRSGEKLL